MNQIFSFHKELNKKKIVFVAIALIILLGSIIFIFLNKSNKIAIGKQTKNLYDTFYDANNTISLKLSKDYQLSQSNSTNHLIELNSPNDIHILITHNNIVSNHTLYDITNADIKAYIEEFDRYSNLSELKESETNGNLTYTYSFHYLDSKTKTTYYLQVAWLQLENDYYVFDIVFPLEKLNEYSKIINETLDNFQLQTKNEQN